MISRVVLRQESTSVKELAHYGMINDVVIAFLFIAWELWFGRIISRVYFFSSRFTLKHHSIDLYSTASPPCVLFPVLHPGNLLSIDGILIELFPLNRPLFYRFSAAFALCMSNWNSMGTYRPTHLEKNSQNGIYISHA
jgi:hypothetical protein